MTSNKKHFHFVTLVYFLIKVLCFIIISFQVSFSLKMFSFIFLSDNRWRCVFLCSEEKKNLALQNATNKSVYTGLQTTGRPIIIDSCSCTYVTCLSLFFPVLSLIYIASQYVLIPLSVTSIFPLTMYHFNLPLRETKRKFKLCLLLYFKSVRMTFLAIKKGCYIYVVIFDLFKTKM